MSCNKTTCRLKSFTSERAVFFAESTAAIDKNYSIEYSMKKHSGGLNERKKLIIKMEQRILVILILFLLAVEIPFASGKY